VDDVQLAPEKVPELRAMRDGPLVKRVECLRNISFGVTPPTLLLLETTGTPTGSCTPFVFSSFRRKTPIRVPSGLGCSQSFRGRLTAMVEMGMQQPSLRKLEGGE
jgi:hypothetical protein